MVEIYSPSERCWREVALLWIGGSSCKADRLACAVKRPGSWLYYRTRWGSVGRDRQYGVAANDRTKRITDKTAKTGPVIGKYHCGELYTSTPSRLECSQRFAATDN